MPLSGSVQQLRETWNQLRQDFRFVREDWSLEYPSLASTARKIQGWVTEYADLLFMASSLTAVWWAPWHVAIGAIAGIMSASMGTLTLKDEHGQQVCKMGDFMSTPSRQGWISVGMMISRFILRRGVAAFAAGFVAADFVIHEARRLTWERSGHS